MEIDLRVIERGEGATVEVKASDIGILAFSPLIVYTYKDIKFLGRCDTIIYHLMYVQCEIRGIQIPRKTEIKKEYLSMRHLNLDKLKIEEFSISTRNRTIVDSEGVSILSIESTLSIPTAFYKTIISILSGNSLNRIPKKWVFYKGHGLEIMVREHLRGSSLVVSDKVAMNANIWRDHLMALGASKNDADATLDAILTSWVNILNERVDKNAKSTKGKVQPSSEKA